MELSLPRVNVSFTFNVYKDNGEIGVRLEGCFVIAFTLFLNQTVSDVKTPFLFVERDLI
jgi:hypothetical protein